MGEEFGASGLPFEGKQGVGDFFAPFYRVRFITPSPNIRDTYDVNGELIGTSQGTERAEFVTTDGASEVRFEDGNIGFLRNFVTSLEVTDQGGDGTSGGGASVATLRLEPPWEDALYILEHKLIQYGSVMVIEFGWLANEGGAEKITSDPHYFIIQTPSLSVENTDISIEIVGSDIFGYASTQRTTSRTWVREPSFKTDLKVLEKIVLPMKLTIDTSLTNEPPPGTKGLNVEGAGIGVLLVAPPANITKIHRDHPIGKEPAILEQKETDWSFFKSLCSANNCAFFTIGKTIFLADMNVVRTRKVSYTLILFGEPKGDKDVPIINISFNVMDQIFQPATARSTRAISVDPDTNKAKNEDVDPATSADFNFFGTKTVAGKGSSNGLTIKIDEKNSFTPDPEFQDNQEGKVWSMPFSLMNKKEAVTQPARGGTLVGADSATVTVPGMPTIVPMMVVEIRGAPASFNGPYWVISAKHMLNTDGYETELSLTRDTSTADVEIGPQSATQPSTIFNPKQENAVGEGVLAQTPDGESPTKTRRNVRIS